MRSGHLSGYPIIAELQGCAGQWPAFRLRRPVGSGNGGDIAERVYPLNAEYGFSAELVALADGIVGAGGWRVGVCSASRAPTLVKWKAGEPWALIAAARRTTSDWMLS